MKALIVAASVVLSTAGTGIQDLTQEETATAVAQGLAGKTLQKKCSAYGEGGVDIVIEGPVGRIMRDAREAKSKHHEFTVADVIPSLYGPWLTVSVRRDPTLVTPASAVPMKAAGGGVMIDPWSAGYTSIPIHKFEKDIVLRSKPSGAKEPIVVGPSSLTHQRPPDGDTRVPTVLIPVFGGDMIALFQLAAFRALPPGDVEVVVYASNSGEHKCKIDDKERKALR